MREKRRWLARAALLWISSLCVHVTDAAGRFRFLIASSPRLSKVSYVALNVLRGTTSLIRPLIIPGNEVDSPRGMCVDVPRNRLYVTDPGVTSRKIYWYELESSAEDEIKIKGPGRPAALQVDANWCAVDHVGNLFFTEAGVNGIKKVPASVLIGEGVSSPNSAEVLYTDEKTAELSGPAGLVADNFHLYWGNTVIGQTRGTIGRAPQMAIYQDASRKIAANADTVHGVCNVGSHVYFTEKNQKLHAVAKTGGIITQIADTFVEPRGCAWDGGGSLYVADRQGGAVYELPVNLPQPSKAAAVTNMFSIEDAFDVALFEAA
ncbi:unnamed protein product [Amoebophrya sp. A120]|nr:unnamed protein product [Amoebophrya sp. A120]|eukprot:GSA120T00023466001.1